MTQTDLTLQAAARIAGHVRELRKLYPTGLGDLKVLRASRGQKPAFEWPDWCWLPMGAAATIVQQRGLRHLADAARLAAVGQWKLHSRSIVIPSAEVVRSAEPGIPGYFHDVDTMEMAIPRDRLLAELGAACHYLVTPFSMPVEHTGSWLYGSYIHLEYDKDAGRTELRLLLDFGTGWDGLYPVFTHADQPSLLWSAHDIVSSITDDLAHLPRAAESFAETMRTYTWLAWPLVGSLLDEHAVLIGPSLLGDESLDVMVRGARVWALTHDHDEGLPLP
ncbi:hypothetical protein ACSDR0_46475 [Streptosporangium sp. G11]|uniref:hypothetical protein n=1 Tax=Streptosporangium sp. G11 TaxID=3436926 RepID=UPI003EBC42CF